MILSANLHRKLFPTNPEKNFGIRLYSINLLILMDIPRYFTFSENEGSPAMVPYHFSITALDIVKTLSAWTLLTKPFKCFNLR